MKKTFTQKVKTELCNKEYDPTLLKSLLLGFFITHSSFQKTKNQKTANVNSKTPLVTKFINKTLKQVAKTDSFWLSLNTKANQNATVNPLKTNQQLSSIKKDSQSFANLKNSLKTVKQKNAFLIGVFLASGSINNPKNTNYHFEIRNHNPKQTKLIQRIFKSIQIKVLLTKRNQLDILYVKNSEMIADILKHLQATNALFEFEEKRIFREYNNQILRLNNLDLSNIKKSVLAGQKQVNWINKIKTNSKLYCELTKKEKIFCEIRLKYPEISLSEIVEIFENQFKIKITKMGLNHYVRKIKELAS